MKNKKIDLEKIKQISIKEFLSKIDCELKNDRGYYGMYCTPYREDSDPSMKVDLNKNLWVDYGTGEGGSIIDLLMKIESCSFTEALDKLRNMDSFSFHCPPTPQIPIKKNNKMKITKEIEIIHPALIQYLDERCINLEVARQYCKEIHYENNGKSYFAIGFKNNSGGYELRNSYYKGCSSKDITFIETEVTMFFLGKEIETSLHIYEGFMDFLAAVTTVYDKENNPSYKYSADSIILNSTSNYNKLLPYLSKYIDIQLYLDNDEAGNKCTELIMEYCSERELYATDNRRHYADFKDLNDYLIHITKNTL